ncbi:unnamed protein product [Pylaiella littoralis]
MTDKTLSLYNKAMYNLDEPSVEKFRAAVDSIMLLDDDLSQEQKSNLFLKLFRHKDLVLPYLYLDKSILEYKGGVQYINIYRSISKDLNKHLEQFGDVNGDFKHLKILDFLYERRFQLENILALDEYVDYPLKVNYSDIFKRVQEATNSIEMNSLMTDSSERHNIKLPMS